jgi:putative ABC transport system substrate-binding protein
MRISGSYSHNRKSKIQNRQWAALVVFAIAFALCGAAADAQPMRKVGFLGAADASANAARVEGFRQGLRELGYVEGKNISIEYRWAQGKPERLPALAAELVRLKVDVLVTAGPAATRPAKEATKTIPIIMAQDNDPVASGFVASLARPGGNITGLSGLFPEMTGKRLELVRDVVPKLSRMAVFGTPDQPGNAQTLKETEIAARNFGVEIQVLYVTNSKNLEAAFQIARKSHADAGLVLSSAVIFSQRPQIARLAADDRLPIMFPQSEYVEDGGLMSYAPNYPDMFRRAAHYVDKILKGAKAADLPVQQPTKFELVINLKTAKKIGLTIPPNVLARADRVIK